DYRIAFILSRRKILALNVSLTASFRTFSFFLYLRKNFLVSCLYFLITANRFGNFVISSSTQFIFYKVSILFLKFSCHRLILCLNIIISHFFFACHSQLLKL